MSGVIVPIESKTIQNDYFRQVLTTTEHLQLVVMSLQPEEDIGMETHADVDQFIRVEEGEVTVFLDGAEQKAKAGDAVVVSAGVEHNIVNRSSQQKAKLYTIYAPPNHAEGKIHRTKADALSDKSDRP